MTDALGYYRADMQRLLRKYSPARRDELVRAYISSGKSDGDLLDEIVTAYLWVPFQVARKGVAQGIYRNADVEDLIQEGNLAIYVAIKSWNPDGGASLATWIKWGCTRMMRLRDMEARSVVKHAGEADLGYDSTDSLMDSSWAVDEGTREANLTTTKLQRARLDEGSDFAELEILADSNAHLWDRVSELSKKHARVIRLLFLDNRSTRYAAEVMRTSPTTICKWRDEALSELSDRLRE